MHARVVAFVCLFLLFLGFVSALPSPDLALRQVASITVPAALASPTSFTTTNTVQTANGTMTETCVFTFTPVGRQIHGVQNCTTVMGAPQASTTPVPASSTTSPMAAVAFVMPGTTIQVLPVGLGIFGGITAVAVAVVAFVTWERVQARKTFRQERVVEINSMGYSRVAKGGFPS